MSAGESQLTERMAKPMRSRAVVGLGAVFFMASGFINERGTAIHGEKRFALAAAAKSSTFKSCMTGRM
jgi:hypothetical protein